MHEIRRNLAESESIQVHELVDCMIGEESEELEKEFSKRRKRVVKLAAKGEQIESREIRNIKRNDPCPCGSNIKFKKCCGKRI